MDAANTTPAEPARPRCQWAQREPMISYHDREWGTPLHDDQRLFEFLILEGAQAGLSWETILKKRENYRAAFDQFDPAMVAAYDEAKVAALLADAGIIRNRLKINAAIQNAKAFLHVQAECGPQQARVAVRDLADIAAYGPAVRDRQTGGDAHTAASTSRTTTRR